MLDFQSASLQKDLAVYRLKGAIAAIVGFTWLSAEERVEQIERALAECEAEREAIEARRGPLVDEVPW